MKLIKLAAGYALGRAAIRQVRRVQRRRRASRRRSTVVTLTALGAGVVAAWITRDLWLRREERPEWPSRKKVEREERQREAKARDLAPHQPPKVTVERNADTSLRASLGEVAGQPGRG